MKKQTLLRDFFIFFTAAWLMGAAVAEPPTVPAAPAKANNLLSEARQLVEAGDLLAAKEKYRIFLLSRKLSSSLKRDVRREMEALNCKILFSKIITPGSILYEVKKGDSLYKIAKDYKTTPALIARSNQMTGFTIYYGTKLKVVTAPFSIKVSLSKNKLYLLQSGEVLKTYSVATGQNQSTPVGTFTIENKLINPTWYRTGAVVPPGSPENILGTRWLGFSAPSFGIHGTTKPESIGTSASAGCVRMLNEDVEELYDIVPVKTTVTIVA